MTDRFRVIAELVDWAATHNDPDAAMRQLTELDRAARPDFYADMDAAFVDVDGDLAPEEA